VRPESDISSSSCSTSDSAAMSGLLEAAACRDGETRGPSQPAFT
jgi:hypothetical protein